MGVFGDNHINQAILTNCEINRFDIHCYGKDILMKNCILKNDNTGTSHVINRYSSVYGYVRYENCTFYDFRPIRIDEAYNIFNGFDVYLKDCTLVLTHNSYNCLVDSAVLNDEINPRLEHRKKCLPNIFVEGENGLTIRLSSGVTYVRIVSLSSNVTYPEDVSYMSMLQIANKINWQDANGIAMSATAKQQLTLYDCQRAVSLAQPLITNINVMANGVNVISNIVGETV